MLVQSGKSTYVIVVGNEKGGSGKSTLAIHVAIGLMQAGQRVATIDLDSRQQSLTHYIENRRRVAPAHRTRSRMFRRIASSRAAKACATTRMKRRNSTASSSGSRRRNSSHDFIVVDTPGSDSYLMRLAHSMADTLITPLNDSFVDFDVLGAVDPVTYSLTQTSHYAEMVRDARRARRKVDQNDLDWIVVRNRLSSTRSRNKSHIAAGLSDLGLQLGFRRADGFIERTIYRELFPRGLTAFDIGKTALGKRPSQSHMMAQQEAQELLAALRLPVDEKGRRRVGVRAEWFASASRPLELDDVLS